MHWAEKLIDSILYPGWNIWNQIQPLLPFHPNIFSFQDLEYDIIEDLKKNFFFTFFPPKSKHEGQDLQTQELPLPF